MKPEFLTRQMDLIGDQILGEPITVIGAGAIGSFTVLALSKMGFGNIRVYDDDLVDTVNMNSQFYPPSMIGRPKVEALSTLVQDFTGMMIERVNARYTGGIFPGIVISAVDSMQARELIWKEHFGHAPLTKLVIDPRMGAQVALCYAMNPNDPHEDSSYRKTLYTDSQAVQEPCTAKATMYTVLGISSVVANIVKQRLSKEPYTRTLQWDFKTNHLNAWSSEGKKSSQ